jgi:hypothetical protein
MKSRIFMISDRAAPGGAERKATWELAGRKRDSLYGFEHRLALGQFSHDSMKVSDRGGHRCLANLLTVISE